MDEVIAAALAEMEARSVRFTMEDLTRRLRMSKTSLYKIVTSKEQLIHAIIDYLMAEFKREVEAIHSENFPLGEKIRQFVRAYTRAFRYFEYGTYNDLKAFYPKEWQRWDEFRRQEIDNLMTLMKNGIDAGAFRPINLAVMQRCLLVTSESLADSKFLSKNHLSYAQAIENMCEWILYGFVKK